MEHPDHATGLDFPHAVPHTPSMSVIVCAFYKFVAIDQPELLQSRLTASGRAHGIKGTILLAREGLNATISGTADGMAAFLEALTADARFCDLTVKRAPAPDHPFRRFKVKVKREIIAFDPEHASPLARVGHYVKPEDWNALISDPDVIVLDTRNAYEVAVGTFQNALDPKTAAFGNFRAYVAANLDPARHRKVAMFCTGGIRCEKASAHLLDLGFAEVYHLDGGILNYLEKVPPEQSLWHGECFVFDERVAVTHGNRPGTHTLCPNCGFPLSADAAPSACPSCAARTG